MEYLIYTLTKALGWSIFHSLWQSAILFILLIGLFALFPSMKSKLKHDLSLVFQSLMFLSFCATFYKYFDWTALKYNYSSDSINYSIQASIIHDNFFQIPKEFSDQWFPIISIVYALGLIFQVIWVAIAYKKTVSLRKNGLSEVPNQWQEKFKSTLGKLNLKGNIQFYLSNKIDVPLVVGYAKPIILFPFCLANRLSMEQMEAILIHELAHIKRNDYILNLLKTTFETLMFFNPFVWLTSFHIKIEREHACDDLVVENQVAPFQYAEALLNLEISKVTMQHNLALKAAESKYHIYQRIKRITKMKSNYQNTNQKLAMLGISFLSLITITLIEIKPTLAKSEVKIPAITTTKVALSTVNKVSIDTPKKKAKQVTITLKDNKGKTHVYNSVDELPDSIKVEFKAKMKSLDSNINFQIAKSMKSMAENMKRFEGKRMSDPAERVKEIQKRNKEINLKLKSVYEGKDWKEQQEKLIAESQKMKKFFEGKEWKENQAIIIAQSENMKKMFEGKEWKENQAKLFQSIKDLDFNFKFEGMDMKKVLEDNKKLKESPEYIELKKKFDLEVEKLKKEKGLGTKS